MSRDRGISKYGPWRRCSSCGGTCRWVDDAWVCDDCGDEWYLDHDPGLYYAPGDRVPIKISAFVAGEARVFGGTSPYWDPELVRALSRLGTSGGTIYLERPALLDLAEWADGRSASLARRNPSGSNAFAKLADVALGFAEDLAADEREEAAR